MLSAKKEFTRGRAIIVENFETILCIVKKFESSTNQESSGSFNSELRLFVYRISNDIHILSFIQGNILSQFKGPTCRRKIARIWKRGGCRMRTTTGIENPKTNFVGP